jgi:hypothetical protein
MDFRSKRPTHFLTFIKIYRILNIVDVPHLFRILAISIYTILL